MEHQRLHCYFSVITLLVWYAKCTAHFIWYHHPRWYLVHQSTSSVISIHIVPTYNKWWFILCSKFQPLQSNFSTVPLILQQFTISPQRNDYFISIDIFNWSIIVRCLFLYLHFNLCWCCANLFVTEIIIPSMLFCIHIILLVLFKSATLVLPSIAI